MRAFKIWLKASRLPAQLFIFPSLLLGQAVAFSLTENFNWGRFIGLLIFGFCMHFFIVYGNDTSDYETDRLNKTYTPFTGGSRVLIEGELSRKQLLNGTLVMAGLCIGFGIVFTLWSETWLALILVVAGLVLLQAYSFNPIRMSYRGFGEILQMLGVGLVLPLIGFIVQGGAINNIPWAALIVLLPGQLGMAISTALPDAPSDQKSSKRTTAVLLGNTTAKWLMFSLYLVGYVSLVVMNVISFDSIIGVTSILMLGGLLFIQGILINFKKSIPGESAMVSLVFISILLNTLMVIAVTLQYFLVA